LAYLGLAWWALVGPASWKRPVVVAISGFMLGVVADDTGTIAAIALSIAVPLHGCRAGNARPAGAIVLAASGWQGGFLPFYGLVAPPVGGSASIAGFIPMLFARIHEWWQWLAIPLSASVAHRSQLQGWGLAEATPWMTLLVAGVLLVAHGWFWWKALAGRRNAAAFVATCQMLLFYGLLAGMLLARVSQHGSEYLWQPRYVLIYQWNVVALLLMALAQLRPGGGGGVRTDRAAIATVVAAALVLCLQVPLSLQSWQVQPYAKRFQQRQAMQMRHLAGAQAEEPARCVHTLLVCKYPAERRARVMGFLRDQQLSVFSPGFADRRPQLAVDLPEKRRGR